VLDRLIEYFIGDGPQNRFALICAECHSHNGMALREEFEYIGNICTQPFTYYYVIIIIIIILIIVLLLLLLLIAVKCIKMIVC